MLPANQSRYCYECGTNWPMWCPAMRTIDYRCPRCDVETELSTDQRDVELAECERIVNTRKAWRRFIEDVDLAAAGQVELTGRIAQLNDAFTRSEGGHLRA